MKSSINALAAGVLASSLTLSGCAPRLIQIETQPDTARVYVDGEPRGRGGTEIKLDQPYGLPRAYTLRVEQAPYPPYVTTIQSRPDPWLAGLWTAFFAGIGLFGLVTDSPDPSVSRGDRTAASLIMLAISPLSFLSLQRFDPVYRVDVERRQTLAMNPGETPAPRPETFRTASYAYSLIKNQCILRSGDRQLAEGGIQSLLAKAGKPSEASVYLRRTGENPFQVIDQIYQDLGLKSDDPGLEHALIDGMAASLHNPYNAFLEPALFKRHVALDPEQLGDAGLSVYPGPEHLIVIGAREESSAWKAGLRTGDRILRIGDVPTRGMSYDAALTSLQGFKGSRVKVLIQREDEKTREVELSFARPSGQAVESRMLPGKIGYLRIASFDAASTEAEVQKALDELKASNGLILDLRNSASEAMHKAVSIARMFVKRGILTHVISAESNTLSADGQVAYPENQALVVLVDRGSAGAAEVLAAAIQENRRGSTLGTPTFGLGLVHTLFPLGDGSGIRLTTQAYLTPTEETIAWKGLQPDAAIAMGPRSPRGQDVQLAAALAMLRQNLTPAEVETRFGSKRDI